MASSSDPASSAGLGVGGEPELLQLRQSLRLLENDSRALRAKFDFNCVFTKQLEAENFALRERIDEAEAKAARSEENLAEARSTLDAHKQWLAGMERSKANMEAELTTLREDAQSSQAMLELERKRNSKLTFDLEKLDASLQSLQHVRNASSRASFREGLEEMRKNLGTLRFQRQLQAENARVGVIEAERNEALALVKGLEATIAEQQRILNEVQREKLNASSTVGAGERVRGETLGSSIDLTPQQRQGLADSHFLSTPVSPGLHRGSLFDDLEEAEDDEEDGMPQQQALTPVPAPVPAPAPVPVAAAPTIVVTPAVAAPKPAAAAASSHSSQSADELEEALADVRAQLLAAQAQLQSSRSSRVQVETSYSTAQNTIAELEQEVAAEAQCISELKTKLDATQAQATKELTSLREQHATALRTLKEEHSKQSTAAAAQLAEVTASNQSAVAKLQASHAAALQSLESSHLEALTAAKTKIQQETEAQSATKLAFLTKQHATAVAEQDAQHQKALAALQAQLATAEASAREASSRAAAEIAKSTLEHKAHLAECELLWTEGLDKIRAELDVSRSARRTFESALMAAQQSARDHVCSAPASASDELKLLQSSLAKAQAFGREQEALVTELRQSSMANNESLTILLKQTNDVKAQTQRTQEQQAKAIAEAAADLTRTQTQLAALQKSHSDLSAEHAALQVALRQSKSSCDDLTLQLASLQSHEQSSRESAALQTDQLSKLVDQWQRECEKRKTAMEASKKDASAKIDALNSRIKELEDKIASHVCVSTGSHVISGSGALRVNNPSASPQAVASPASASSMDISIGVYPGSAGSPGAIAAASELKPSLLTVVSPSTARSSSGAPTPSPMVSSAFAKTGLAAGLVMEIHAYAQFISRALGSDPDLKHLFPLDLAPPSAEASSPLPVSASSSTTLVHNFAGCGLDLLRKMRDGLLIAKLINVVSPRTIDERVLNKRGTAGGVPGWRSIVENLNVCMTSAKTLGITMRVPQDSNNAATAAMEAAAEIDAEAEARGAGARASLGGDEKDASVPSASSPSANYVAVELGSAQLVLMSCDSTLENLEIVLDFLFQLLRARFTTSLFGPEARKIARLGPMVSLPMLAPDLKKAMTARTMSLAMPINDAPAAASALPKRSPRPGATLSKFATLSRALPANLSTNEHRKFVQHFTSSTLAEYGATSELNCLTPEQLLLRWINFALMRQAAAGAASSTAGSAIAGVHFVAHLSDLDVTTYALLLAQIDAWRLEKGLASASDPLFDTSSATSASVLAYLSTPAMHVEHFHTSSTLASKHERLNLLLISLIFAQWSMMDEPVPTPSPSSPTPMVVSTLSPSKSIAGAPAGRVRQVSMGHEAFAVASGAASSSASSSGKVVVTNRVASTFVPPSGLEELSEEEGESLLLKSYLNSCGIPHVHINNLFHDVRTGLILLRLVDWLQHGRNVIDWRTSVELTPSNKFKCISNLNYFLRVTRESLLIPFVNIGAVDIYSESNSKYVLAIIWQLLRFQTISKLKEIRSRMQREEDGTGQQHKEITDQSILEWANSKVKSRVHPLAQRFNSIHAASFQDPALRNSLFLLNLLDNLQEGAVDWNVVEVTEGVDPADVGQLLLRNASYTISIARKLGAELFALPQDIVSGNKKQLVLILASLMAIEYGLQSDEAAR